MGKINQKWIDKAGLKQAIDYYEGNNPPYIADVDTFHLYDAAGFPTGTDTDIVFKLNSDVMDISKGFKIFFEYVVSVTSIGSKVRFKLDYIGHDLHNNIGTVVNYLPQTTDITLDVNANVLDELVMFTVPNGTIGTAVEEIELRITRKGTDSNDNYSGDFGLKQIIVMQL